MAVELRHENLYSTDNSASSSDSAAEFRNDSSRMIHIREIDMDLLIKVGANDENVTVEISKSPVLASRVNNNVFFTQTLNHGINAGTIGSGADDVADARGKSRKYGKGQLTLEPGESLYLNWAKSSGLTIESFNQIRYEFHNS